MERSRSTTRSLTTTVRDFYLRHRDLADFLAKAVVINRPISTTQFCLLHASACEYWRPLRFRKGGTPWDGDQIQMDGNDA